VWQGHDPLGESDALVSESLFTKIIRVATVAKFFSFIKYGTFWVDEFPPPLSAGQLLCTSLELQPQCKISDCLVSAAKKNQLVANLFWILEFLKVIFLRDDPQRYFHPLSNFFWK